MLISVPIPTITIKDNDVAIFLLEHLLIVGIHGNRAVICGGGHFCVSVCVCDNPLRWCNRAHNLSGYEQATAGDIAWVT